MRNIDEINAEINKLFQERSEILKQQREIEDAKKFVGKYIQYTEVDEVKQTLLPFKHTKTYVMRVREAKNPNKEFVSFTGPGIIIEKNHVDDEFYTASLDMNLFIMSYNKYHNVKTISEEEYFEHIEKVINTCNKLKDKENGFKNGENIIYTERELKSLLNKYECKNEEELDEYLWYNFGVSLINKINEN
jgi:hypothetical protein